MPELAHSALTLYWNPRNEEVRIKRAARVDDMYPPVASGFLLEEGRVRGHLSDEVSPLDHQAQVLSDFESRR